MSREASKNAFSRAMRIMPGGVNSPARAFGGVGGDPIFIREAQGPWLIDIDGNHYLDFIGSWGPMILGHGHPAVVSALEAAIRRGTSYGAPTLQETELAELIIEAVPSVEKVRLVNSGTEATMSAIRLARGYTSRPIVIKFAGNYHGHVDSLLVAAGSSAATLGVPNSPGVTEGTVRDTLVLPYNDPEALADAFAQSGDQIAAVIFEPVVGNMGCVVPSEEYLFALRDLTHRYGAVLICDEVMTGFRVAYGGAQSLWQMKPDLTTLGKVIGGGLPVGAYGGAAKIMDHILPAGKVFQAGTLSGNPLATAAGIATLKVLRDGAAYPRLEQSSSRLAAGLARRPGRRDSAHADPRGLDDDALFPSRAGDRLGVGWPKRHAALRRYFWGMIDRGVYLPCSQFEALFVSTAHSDEHIEATIAAAVETFTTL